MHRLPRLYHKLCTNIRPTAEEENKVKRARRETLIKINAIETETARLQDRLAILHQKSEETERYLDVHQGFISPIRRLVPEILQEIFWHCLPTAHNSVFSFKEAPLILGRVCNLWRQIAYSTPRLWCSLHITVVPFVLLPPYPPAAARLEAFNAWLTRSGVLPLYISMATIRGSYIYMREFQPYFDLIAKHVRRLKSVHLRVNLHASISNHIMDIPASDLPLLETLYIHQRPCKPDGAPPSPFSGLKDNILSAPSLRVLSIQEHDLRVLDLPVRWSLLTGLNFVPRAFEISDVFEVLRLCSNLETCGMNFGVSVASFSLTSFINKPKVVLPKLRTLKMYGGLTSNSDSMIVLSSLSAPSLRHLAYEHITPLPPPSMIIPFSRIEFSLDIFHIFFQKLHQPLEELEFATDGLETRYLMELLELLPGLKRLSLKYAFLSTGSAVNDCLLLGFIPPEHKNHCLTCSSDKNWPGVGQSKPIIPPFHFLCPRIEVLYVNDAIFSEHVLLEFLQSRLVEYDMNNCAHLRRFAITFDHCSSRLDEYDIAEAIDRFAEESGIVDLRVSRGPDDASPSAWGGVNSD